MKLTLHRFELPLLHPFTISRGTITSLPTLIVELSDGRSHGLGEAPQSRYFGATIEKMIAAVERVRDKIEAHDLKEPAALWESLQPDLAADPFALCALDQAAHDLWGKRLGKKVYEIWGWDISKNPPIDYTIGIDALPVMLAKLAEAPDLPVYKIKLGGGQDDVAVVRDLRRHTTAKLRVDANGGWTADEAIVKIRELAELGVELVEQPLSPDDVAGQRRVFAESALPVIADESCRGEGDVATCAEMFHGINVKLVKCGGLTPAKRMLEAARRLGLKTMIGCMTESTVGVSAAAQLLPLVDYADLDGPLLLASDIASGVTFERGRVIYPEEHGCGVRLL
jgi:L-alanine-DL-glutamate epimerase-like enolase superfamily enzyme